MKRILKSDVEIIKRLQKQGKTKRYIATQIGIEYSGLMYYFRNKEKYNARLAELVYARDFFKGLNKFGPFRKSRVFGHTGSTPVPRTKIYAYVFGLYLGDGYINKQGKYTYKIRVTQDIKYPNLIAEHKQAFRELIGNNPATNKNNKKANCIDIQVHSNQLPILFPQYIGSGLKNQKRMVLENWQQQIINEYPWEFLRGLIQTDGSRYIHTLTTGHKYAKYNFTNTSPEIIRWFLDACNKIGLQPTIHSRPSISFFTGKTTGNTKHTVTFNKRQDVKLMDVHIGAKT